MTGGRCGARPRPGTSFAARLQLIADLIDQLGCQNHLLLGVGHSNASSSTRPPAIGTIPSRDPTPCANARRAPSTQPAHRSPRVVREHNTAAVFAVSTPKMVGYAFRLVPPVSGEGSSQGGRLLEVLRSHLTPPPRSRRRGSCAACSPSLAPGPETCRCSCAAPLRCPPGCPRRRSRRRRRRPRGRDRSPSPRS